MREAPDVPASNPYVFQNHVYDKTRPENLGFLHDLRALLDTYPDKTTVGEVGASERGLEVMAEYTSGGDKLHMCYAFDLLNEKFGARYIRERLEVYERIVTEGWGCWAFTNHDVMRSISRWGFDDVADQAAPLLLAMQLSLRGTPCIYEGEELGLSEAVLSYDEIQDPYGKTFWPDFKGRDGCRTPIPWDSSPGAGFTTGKPWLPIPDAQRQRSVAAQEDAAALDAEPGAHAAALAARDPSADPRRHAFPRCARADPGAEPKARRQGGALRVQPRPHGAGLRHGAHRQGDAARRPRLCLAA